MFLYTNIGREKTAGGLRLVKW